MSVYFVLFVICEVLHKGLEINKNVLNPPIKENVFVDKIKLIISGQQQ